MRTLLVILLALVTCLPAAAQQTEAQIKAHINSVAKQMQTMQCDFVQTKHVKLLNDKMTSTGRMYFSGGTKLRWEYVKPYSYIFIINGSQVAVRKGERNDVVNVNQSKLFREIARVMMNSVTGHCINDSKDFKTTLQTTKTEWVATLVPAKKTMKQMFQKIVLHFNRQQSMVSSVEMVEKNGDRTVIQLKNVQVNKKIAESVFAVR